MRLWWSPDADVDVDVLVWDLVPGGRWRFSYTFPDGRADHVGGTFRTIEPPRRLSFTWTWEPPDVHAGMETLVSVTLDEAAGATTVLVRHERFPDRATRDRHDIGWTSTLERLLEAL